MAGAWLQGPGNDSALPLGGRTYNGRGGWHSSRHALLCTTWVQWKRTSRSI